MDHITNSMEQSLFCIANSHSASQEVPPPFMEREVPLLCSQELTIGPYPEPHESSPHLSALFL